MRNWKEVLSISPYWYWKYEGLIVFSFICTGQYFDYFANVSVILSEQSEVENGEW